MIRTAENGRTGHARTAAFTTVKFAAQIAMATSTPISAASRAAAASYLAFRDTVAALYFTDRTARVLQPRFAADAYVMGEAEYDWALANNFRLTTRAATQNRVK